MPKIIQFRITPFIPVINQLYKPKTPLDKPNFQARLLKITWKSIVTHTSSCHDFNRFPLCYAADLLIQHVVTNRLFVL